MLQVQPAGPAPARPAPKPTLPDPAESGFPALALLAGTSPPARAQEPEPKDGGPEPASDPKGAALSQPEKEPGRPAVEAAGATGAPTQVPATEPGDAGPSAVPSGPAAAAVPPAAASLQPPAASIQAVVPGPAASPAAAGMPPPAASVLAPILPAAPAGPPAAADRGPEPPANLGRSPAPGAATGLFPVPPVISARPAAATSAATLPHEQTIPETEQGSREAENRTQVQSPAADPVADRPAPARTIPSRLLAVASEDSGPPAPAPTGNALDPGVRSAEALGTNTSQPAASTPAQNPNVRLASPAGPGKPAEPAPQDATKAAEPRPAQPPVKPAEAPASGQDPAGGHSAPAPRDAAPALPRSESLGLQPSQAPAANPTGATAAVKSTTPIWTPAAPSVLQQVDGGIRWMLRNAAQGAELQLHPEALGRVRIELKVEGGDVHARLWASDPKSIPVLQENKAFLEVSLKEQGLNLGSFDLRQQSNQPQSPFADQGSRGQFWPTEAKAGEPGQDAPSRAAGPAPMSRRIELIA